MECSRVRREPLEVQGKRAGRRNSPLNGLLCIPHASQPVAGGNAPCVAAHSPFVPATERWPPKTAHHGWRAHSAPTPGVVHADVYAR